MNEQQETNGKAPSVVCFDGQVVANGHAIALRIIRNGQEPVHICLRIADLQYVVSMLLWLGFEARHRQSQVETDARPSGAIHLPVSALNVGSDDRNDTFLTLEVGATDLMFRLLPKCLKELGEALLALSANRSSKPS